MGRYIYNRFGDQHKIIMTPCLFFLIMSATLHGEVCNRQQILFTPLNDMHNIIKVKKENIKKEKQSDQLLRKPFFLTVHCILRSRQGSGLATKKTPYHCMFILQSPSV